MKVILVLIVGVLIGVGAYWYLSQPRSIATKPNTAMDDIRETVRQSATNMGQTLKETFDSDKIKEELARTGKVIREKAKQAGEVVADAANDARITASIKGKLLKESTLAALQIDVDTTAGMVTLSGAVSSHADIEKAIKLAFETEGVHKVVSTLQVKAK